MHDNEAGRAVANPRRTKLGADWKAHTAGPTDRPRPTPEPAPEAGAEESPLG
ncbi:hypothetical protein [Saccharothrix xinjiangensis]|uniref:Uncharacterized protein n=1 Tax=Saccharothrix xinjiangensis TaxID=204798 RepID=A0ABV9XZN4_9PSEU